jgi:outer membrane lipoprotein-sorting protein
MIVPLAFADPPDARDLHADLDAIGRTQAAIQTMTAAFVQRRTVTLFDEELVSRGRFRFKRPGRVRWDVESPTAVAMVITPEGIVTREPGAAPAHAEALPVPTAEIIGLISGSVQTVTQHFDVRRPTGHTDDDIFELRPRSPRLSEILQSVTLELAPIDKHIHRVVFNEATGDRTEIVFHQVEINGAIPDATFALDD